MENKKSIVILMADDDKDDCRLTKKALEKSLLNDLRVVHDGEQLMDYLYNRGNYCDPIAAPKPSLILLDLNMPKKDGREALKEIKSNDSLKHIPIVILTTSQEEEDIYSSYNLGANAFITKPVTFPALVEKMQGVGKFWFDIVEIPVRKD